MSNSHDVISALLDDRPFDLPDLAATLEQPEGRALLIDLLALRRIVQPDEAIPSMPAVKVGGLSWVRASVAAAAVMVALAGGYLVGARRTPAVAESAAPAATRIVHPTSSSQEFSEGVR